MAKAGGDFYLCILCRYLYISKLSDESDRTIPDLCILEKFCKMAEIPYGGGFAAGGRAVGFFSGDPAELPAGHCRHLFFGYAGHAAFCLWCKEPAAVSAMPGNEPVFYCGLKGDG